MKFTWTGTDLRMDTDELSFHLSVADLAAALQALPEEGLVKLRADINLAREARDLWNGRTSKG